jgi:CheY-like chemotaxis protein
VLLDIGLPDADGYEVLRQIRAFSDVPVLMLTARDDTMDKVKGLKWARTTMSPGRSTTWSCWRGCGRCCGGSTCQRP